MPHRDLLLSYKGKIAIYDWDGTSDSNPFNRTTGGHLWSGLPGNPEKYAESRRRLEQAIQTAEALVSVRIYTIDGVNAVTSATASVNDAIAGLERDTTPPVVTYTGNAGRYTVDQTISIHCAASDPSPGSGVASRTCADVDGPTYSFGLGSHTYSATAQDVAGNVGSGSTTFAVAVTYPSLERLVSRFSTSADVASGLNDKLIAASQAKTTTARDNQLYAF